MSDETSLHQTRHRSRWSVKEYLGQHPQDRMLTVGCGQTPEQVTMGSMGVSEIPCSLGRRHEHDFTVDISPDAHADLTMDFILYSGSDLYRHGENQFDTVSFEYLNRGPKNPFKDAHIDLWISGANKLLRRNGRILFYSFDDGYIGAAKNAMLRLGYKVEEKQEEPNGTAENRYGHRYCQGTKPTSWLW
ncbi:hypothetical protein DF143_37290 [Burkholderia cenocepacia]|nr:hypothetical protein DF143_37290 [Burkholderia cenocepacia]RQV31954.1 hypothetical protein DF033_36850 [Burkholderia cenocepacia]